MEEVFNTVAASKLVASNLLASKLVASVVTRDHLEEKYEKVLVNC